MVTVNPYASQAPYWPTQTPSAPIAAQSTPSVVATSVTTAPNDPTIYRDELRISKTRNATLADLKPESLHWTDWLLHPFESQSLRNKLTQNLSNESFGTRLAAYRALQSQLSDVGKKRLYGQLIQDRLTDNKADDDRSTLDHLYSMVAEPRARGLSAQTVLEETVRLLSAPQSITQRFGTLTDENLQRLMTYYNSGQGPKITQPIDPDTLRVTSSATCVASSLMYYMAHRCPSEFSRHIAELTSPDLAFYEKAAVNEINPENPALAAQRLNEYGIPATPIPGTGNQLYWVKVDLPYTGFIRAYNQQIDPQPGTRGVVESAYQAALTHLVVRSYDPGLDMGINPDGTLDTYKGLAEDRKTLMESIIKDNGGEMSVTYQFTAAGRDNESYLIGYYRSFDQTQQDLMNAVDNGEDVIIGITDTDTTQTPGRINMGHEITVTGYERDPKTGDVSFIVSDSDDENPNLVKRSAKELIPKIHHAGFPVKQAQRIWNEINHTINNQYLEPDRDDATQYNLVSTVPVQQQPAFLLDYQRMLNQDDNQQTPQQTSPAPTPYRPVMYPLTNYPALAQNTPWQTSWPVYSPYAAQYTH